MTVMTVEDAAKSCSSASSSSIRANSQSNALSDMLRGNKSGARKNLFGTSVDRNELQQQMRGLER
jgi:hypothetical protein